MSQPSPELLDLFHEEARGRIQLLNQAIQRTQNSQSLDPEIALILHTLKGSARMVGLDALVDCIHAFEDEISAIEVVDETVAKLLEDRFHELSSLFHEKEADFPSSIEGGLKVNDPAALAQKLLASVTKLEILQSEFSSELKGRTNMAGNDDKIGLRYSLEKEIKLLHQHSHQLAVGDSSDVFAGMRSLAERVSKDEGKVVRVHFRNELPKILRTYIPELRGALIHLISNAIVHGVETPKRREKQNKPVEGEILVTLFQSNADLCIDVQDDGAGIDLKAMSSSSKEESLERLFEPGLSFSHRLNLHAGRGVGLTAVRRVAEHYGGRVKIEPLDPGTRVSLRLPCPWFLGQCLIVESQDVSLAVLASGVASIKEYLGKSIGSLAAAAGFGDRRDDPGKIVLHTNDTKGQWLVDVCHGLSERLIYPLPPDLDTRPGLIGIAEYGSRRVLTVDLSLLTVDDVYPRRKQPREVKKKLPAILVVDDSATSRSIVTDVLRRNGFEVTEAFDGVDGWNQLTEGSFALVVSDLEMPNLDGLEFLEKIRTTESTHQDLPFVLFTSRDDTESFERAYLLGADRCIGKSAFIEDEFVRTVRELL